MVIRNNFWFSKKANSLRPTSIHCCLFLFCIVVVSAVSMSAEMLACIQATGLFKSEDEAFIREISEAAIANHFKCDGGKSAKQVFADSEFSDWVFDDCPRTPLHKQAIRRLLQECNKIADNAVAENANSEDGEICDEHDGLKALSQIFRSSVKSSQTKMVHIETATELGKKCGNWGEAKHFVLPPSEGTNFMARELAKLKALNIHKPFVKVPLGKFAPEWCREAKADNFLLQPAMLTPTLFRWAMAAQANDMVPMHVAMTHADICMRVADEASKKGLGSLVAAAYDELKQKSMSEMCVKGAADWDPETILCSFDRELFEQACQMAEGKSSSGRNNWTKNDWKDKSWKQQPYGSWKRPANHDNSRSYKAHRK